MLHFLPERSEDDFVHFVTSSGQYPQEPPHWAGKQDQQGSGESTRSSNSGSPLTFRAAGVDLGDGYPPNWSNVPADQGMSLGELVAPGRREGTLGVWFIQSSPDSAHA